MIGILAQGCSWLAVFHAYEVSFKSDVLTAIHALMKTAVETSAFSNKAFSWNKGYFVSNVIGSLKFQTKTQFT